MAINVSTDSGASLLTAIYKAIDDKHIRTWRYEDHGGVRYLTHSAEQWDRQAWLKGVTQQNGVVFNIVAPQGQHLTVDVYAIYHGRFIEMLVKHFNDRVSAAGATSRAVGGDIIRPA